MRSSTRIAVNTMAQYIRTIVSVCITLYTSRVVLHSLGVDDYGLYALVAGVTAMFAFIQGNLSSTTQRFLSYHQGRKDNAMVLKVFNNSVCTQLIISVTLCIVLAACTDLIFSHIINIPEDKVHTAKIVYWIMLGSLFVNMQSTPYLAALIARENIVYSSIVQIADALIKIPIVLSLASFASHRLELYTFFIFLVTCFNFLCYYVYCRSKYDECKHFTFRSFDKSLFFEMFSFMGWFVYGNICVVGRTQGIAILLNNFFTTAMNAAYGIGGQVCGQLAFLANALTTAFNPRIIKTEGAGDRQKMFRLSEISCKFSFLLMSMVSIPVLFHINSILELWLKDVPEHTSMFCTFILLANQVDLISVNLKAANQAIGNVKVYTLWVNTTKLATVLFAYVVLRICLSATAVMVVFVVFEFICAVVRLRILHFTVDLSITQFLKNVIYPSIPPVVVNVAVCYIVSPFMSGFLFLVTCVISVVVTSLVSYFASLKPDERIIIDNLIERIRRRVKA